MQSLGRSPSLGVTEGLQWPVCLQWTSAEEQGGEITPISITDCLDIQQSFTNAKIYRHISFFFCFITRYFHCSPGLKSYPIKTRLNSKSVFCKKLSKLSKEVEIFESKLTNLSIFLRMDNHPLLSRSVFLLVLLCFFVSAEIKVLYTNFRKDSWKLNFHLKLKQLKICFCF